MSYTPMSDPDSRAVRYHPAFITAARSGRAKRNPDPSGAQQSALADEAAIILRNAGNHRAARYACDEAGHPVSYEDETVLAHGPCVAYSPGRMPRIAIMKTFADTVAAYPQRTVSSVRLLLRRCRWSTADGRISAAANSSAVTTTGRGARKSPAAAYLRAGSSPSSPNRFRTGSAITSITIRHERDNFRILVAITNARFATGYRRAGQRGGERDPSLLPDRRHQRCCAATAGSSTSIPRIILTPATRFDDQSEG